MSVVYCIIQHSIGTQILVGANHFVARLHKFTNIIHYLAWSVYMEIPVAPLDINIQWIWHSKLLRRISFYMHSMMDKCTLLTQDYHRRSRNY